VPIPQKKKKKNLIISEARDGLQLLINKFLLYELLNSCQSAYKTFILLVHKPHVDYRLMQGLCGISAIVPLYAIVPTLYKTLTQIPLDTQGSLS
jgi:hypothetical protein